MNDTKPENINPLLVVRTRPTIKRHVRDANVTHTPSITIAYALVYGLCSALLAGHVAYMVYNIL